LRSITELKYSVLALRLQILYRAPVAQKHYTYIKHVTRASIIAL